MRSIIRCLWLSGYLLVSQNVNAETLMQTTDSLNSTPLSSRPTVGARSDGNMSNDHYAASIPNQPGSIQPSPDFSSRGNFVTGDDGSLWRFIMGPVASKKEVMMFYHDPVTGQGGLSLVCRRFDSIDKYVTVLAPIAPINVKPGEKADVHISIGDDTHELTMTGASGGALIALGPAAIGLITAIGNVAPYQSALLSAQFEGKQILSLQIPSDHDIASNAAIICRDWAAGSKSGT